MRESAIQTSIRKKLQASGWLVNKIITCSVNGWPDLQIHRDGVTLFIECKVPGNKPTPLQVHVHDTLRKAGFTVIIATKTDDILHLCS